MHKLQKEKRSDWRRLVICAVLFAGLLGLFPGRAKAADTQIGYNGNEDIYITGFMSQKPDQALRWKSQVSDASYKNPAFCLPASTDSRTVQIYFRKPQYTSQGGDPAYVPETGYVMIGGEKVYSGDSITLPEKGGLSIGFEGGKTVNVQVLQSEKVPAMFINTVSGSLKQVNADKEYKEGGDMLLIREDGSVDYDSSLKQIKGRGNVTWDYPKKPYNIKLDSSADLLDMGKAKGWCLLANYLDSSMLRNKIVYTMADEVGIPFNMACESIDFYANGEYLGTYLLTEKVEIDKKRVNITDMEKATEEVNTEELDSYTAGGQSQPVRGTRKWRNIPNDPEDITGGYLIEIELNERYAAEACGFVTDRGQSVTMKAPEFVSKAQINYIADLYQDMEDALYSDTGYNKEGVHFTQYIDEESIAKMYLIQEYSMNLDTGITSFYLYKDSDLSGDGKFYMAPVWDFDMAIGNNAGRMAGGIFVPLTNPEEWWANRAEIYNIGGLNILARAVQHESVKKEVVEQWNEVFYPVIRTFLEEEEACSLKNLRTLTEYEQELTGSANMNFITWPDMLSHQITGVYNGGDLAESVAYVRDFLKRRESFLHRSFAYEASKYDRLTGTVSIEGTLQVGETLRANVENSNGTDFTYQWLADGEEIGEAVSDTYVLTEAEIGKEISVSVRDRDKNLLASLQGTREEKVAGIEPEPEPEPDPKPIPDDPKPDPDPTPGPAPVKLEAASVTSVKSTKNGVKITFAGVKQAASYEIYRKAGSVYTKLGTTGNLSYTDKNPVGGKKVSYAVKAVSGDTARYTDAELGKEKTIRLPKAPLSLKAKAEKGKKTTLSWKKVKGAAAYLIYRADSKKGAYKLVAKVRKQSTVRYTDRRGLKKNKTYYYKVAVLKGGKYSPLGKGVKVTVKR